MRFISLMMAALLLASAAAADVRLAVKRDGKKVIYNVGGAPRGSRGGSDLNWLAKRHDRRTKYDPLIEKYANKYGVDPTLVRAVIQVESDFNPACVSNKGARGLMQLMPETAKRFGVTKIHDPEQNIHGGIRYLSYLQDLFHDDLARALAAYNAGENAVIKYGGIPPYEETSEYVQRALTVYNGRPYGTATAFAGGRHGGKKLKGGFGSGLASPLAVALLPGVKVLGRH
jgi:soluble lytic murein transglycosylase-like protein